MGLTQSKGALGALIGPLCLIWCRREYRQEERFENDWDSPGKNWEEVSVLKGQETVSCKGCPDFQALAHLDVTF